MRDKFITECDIQRIVDLATVEIDDLMGYEKNLGFSETVRAFRTVSIILPRRSGKTTAIKNFASGKSALLIDGTVERLPSVVGQRSNGLRYQYVIFDEILRLSFNVVEQLVENLKHADLLTDDFKVIYIGT